MFFYIVLTPISTTSGLWSTGNTPKYQQIDVYIYQCDVAYQIKENKECSSGWAVEKRIARRQLCVKVLIPIAGSLLCASSSSSTIFLIAGMLLKHLLQRLSGSHLLTSMLMIIRWRELNPDPHYTRHLNIWQQISITPDARIGCCGTLELLVTSHPFMWN